MSKNTTIVCFGDSLTAMGTWPDAIAEYFSCRVINAGVGGNTSVEGLARFERDVAPHHPDIVIIGFGTNDQVIYDPENGPQVSKDDFERTIREILDRCKAIGVKHPILLTPCAVHERAYYSRHPKEWCHPYGGIQRILESYRNIIRSIADETNTMLIDVGAFSGGRLENVLGVVGDEGFDGVHPNAEGFALYAKWIIKELEKVL